MPATGGKAYLLLEQDIRDLADSDEYRGQPGVVMAGMVAFSVPQFMLDKMKIQMQAMRTDVPKTKAKTLPEQKPITQVFYLTLLEQMKITVFLYLVV